MHLVFLLYALFAGCFTLSKTALEYSEPFFLIGSRMLLAGVLMIGYEYLFNRKQILIAKGVLLRLFLLAFFNIYVTNACEFYGLKHLTSFKTCFIYSLSPFLSALFSYFLLKETLTKKKWLGLTVGFLGFTPILFSETGAGASSLLSVSWPEIAVAMAAVCSVYGWILLRQLVNENQMTPFMANGISMLLGGIFALGHSLAVETWNPIPVTSFVPFFECAIGVMIISNLLAYNLYGYLLKFYTAPFMSFAGFTTPIFTAILGWFFLGEVVTLPYYISGAIVFSGLYIFHQDELTKGYTVKEPAINT